MRLADMEDFVRQAEREAMRDENENDDKDDDDEGGETGDASTAAGTSSSATWVVYLPAGSRLILVYRGPVYPALQCGSREM